MAAAAVGGPPSPASSSSRASGPQRAYHSTDYADDDPLQAGGLPPTPRLDEAVARHRARLASAVGRPLSTASHLAKLERDIDRLLASHRRPAAARYAPPLTPLQMQTLVPQVPQTAEHQSDIQAESPDAFAGGSPALRDWSPGPQPPSPEPGDGGDAALPDQPVSASLTSTDMPAAEAATAAVQGRSTLLETSVDSSVRVQSRLPRVKAPLPARVEDDSSSQVGDQQAQRPRYLSRSRWHAASQEVEALLGEELSEERGRRLRAESAARTLLQQLEQEKRRSAAGDTRLEDVMKTLRQMEEALMRSGAQVEELRRALQETLNERAEAELNAAKITAELELSRAQIARQAEDSRDQAQELNRLREEVNKVQLAEIERIKALEIELAATISEAQQQRRTAQAAQKQTVKLQALLAEMEARHRNESAQLVHLHGPEVQARIEHERSQQIAIHDKVVQQLEAEIGRGERRYQQLEEEFRGALQIEDARYRELQEAYATLVAENRDHEEATTQWRTKGEEAAAAIQQLSLIVKEQRERLAQSTGQEKLLNERLAAASKECESLRAELASVRAANEKLAAVAEDAKAKVAAHESVIRGLREERALWSQELASQGASLAADRGKLEVEIARLREECEASKAALRTSEDAVKIKNKVIDDQAHTMRVLRQTVADKEREVAGAQEEMRRREANLSDRLEAERQLSQQLQDELQQAQERKSRLKSELSDSQAELEALRREHAKLKTSWQDTAVKLTQLEQAVSGMHQNFDSREQDLKLQLEAAEKARLAAENQLRIMTQETEQKLQERSRQQDATVTMLDRTRAELEAAQRTMAEQEQELREVLREMEQMKKQHAARVDKMQKLMKELQGESEAA